MENEKYKEKLIKQIEETIECLKDFKKQVATFPICFSSFAIYTTTIAYHIRKIKDFLCEFKSINNNLKHL